jgi:FkbM family methyltransferase
VLTLERELLSDALQARLRTGAWKATNMRLIERALTAGDKVVEVGSGFGYCTQVIARQAAPGGVVVGFEPNPLLYQIANQRNEDSPGTLILPVAVGTERGMCRIDGPQREPWRCTITPDPNGRIHMHSLTSDILGGTTKFTALVMDAEGAEHDLLTVDVAKLGIKTIICEVHGTDADVSLLVDRMRGCGWRLEAKSKRDSWDNVCVWWTRKKRKAKP